MSTSPRRDVAAAPPAPEQVFRLVYCSRDRIPAEHRRLEHARLFTASRAANKHVGITGALLVAQDCFVQTLEGDETAVLGLFARIERDTRHDSIEVLRARVRDERVFARWAMARVAADRTQPDTWVIAHADGLAPAATRVASPGQEHVLGVMRSAARLRSGIAAAG